MDKSGIGDLELWHQWNMAAGICFWSLAFLWVAAVLAVVVAAVRSTGDMGGWTALRLNGCRALAVAGPPVFFVLGTVAMLVLNMTGVAL